MLFTPTERLAMKLILKLFLLFCKFSVLFRFSTHKCRYFPYAVWTICGLVLFLSNLTFKRHEGCWRKVIVKIKICGKLMYFGYEWLNKCWMHKYKLCTILIQWLLWVEYLNIVLQFYIHSSYSTTSLRRLPIEHTV